jgi:protein-disulfide isomerase
MMTPGRLLLAALLAAAGIAGALIAVSVGGSGGGAEGRQIAAAQETARLLRGIPQRGEALGDPKAPLTLVEYAEPQCPFCGLWSRQTLPALVRRYVRPGRVRLVFRGLAFIRPTADSERALRAFAAAGRQNRLWYVVELLYRNQGEEGTGWITGDLLEAVLQAVPGLDLARARAELEGDAVSRALSRWQRQAEADGVSGTPTFFLGPSGGRLLRLAVPSAEALADPAFFAAAFDRLLRS